MAIQIDDIAVNLIWLRDNCRCDECYNWDSNQRNSDDIKIQDVQIKSMINEENHITITWIDGHVSKYNVEWIKIQHRPESRPDLELWSGQEKEDEIPTVSDDETPEKVATVLTTSLLRYGIGLVNNVPPTMEGTEKTVKKLGPIMHTIYGGMWQLNNSENFEKYQDTAYGFQGLSVHTDNTYFIEPSGLQVFHCIKPAEKGGETLLVDGFNAARILKEDNPIYYECLKTTPIESQYISNEHYYTCTKPIINTSPNSDRIEQIRYNMYDRTARVCFSKYDHNTFYSSLKHFRDIIHRKDMSWEVHLTPGTVIFLNNWRVFHGRKAFSGSRIITGCYISMNALLSKARMLKLIS